MPYRTHKITSAALLILVILLPGRMVQAVPLLPSSFYGKVLVNNAPVADGTEVQALINGQVVASGITQPYQGDSYYSLSVPSDDTQTASVEGGKEGDVIQFKVGGLAAVETGTWHSGTNVELTLTVTASATPVPPQPTLTPLPTQTPIQVIAATSTPTSAPVLPASTQPVATMVLTDTLTGPAASDLAASEPGTAISTPNIGPTESSPTPTLQPVSEANPASQARHSAQIVAIGIILLAVVTAVVLLVRSRLIRNQK